MLACLSAEWCHALKWAAPSGDDDNGQTPKFRMLGYRNSERHRPVQRPETLDDAVRLFEDNLAIDRYMRDSLGIFQARFEMYVGTSEAADSLRDRIVGILQSMRLQFRPGSADRMELGPAEGYWLNPGAIPSAAAYFALRDSLVSLRAGSVEVLAREEPYRSPFLSDRDSALAFLVRLRDLARQEGAPFGRRLLESFRMTGMDYGFTLGVDCSIVVGRLLTPKEKRERPPANGTGLPPFRLPSRDQPVVARLDAVQTLAWTGIGVSSLALVTGLGLWLAFVLERRRRKRATHPGRPPGSANDISNASFPETRRETPSSDGLEHKQKG